MAESMIERVARAIAKGRWLEESARLAIEAMREPTANMCECGSALERLPAITTSQADEAWTAMIDAALTPPVKE